MYEPIPDGYIIMCFETPKMVVKTEADFDAYVNAQIEAEKKLYSEEELESMELGGEYECVPFFWGKILED